MGSAVGLIEAWLDTDCANSYLGNAQRLEWLTRPQLLRPLLPELNHRCAPRQANIFFAL